MDEDESFLLLSSMLEVNLDVEESEVGINSSGEGRGESAEKTGETPEKSAVNGVESSDQESPTTENHANSAQGDSGVEQDDDHPYARHYSEEGLDEGGHMYIGHNVSEDGAVTPGLDEGGRMYIGHNVSEDGAVTEECIRYPACAPDAEEETALFKQYFPDTEALFKRVPFYRLHCTTCDSHIGCGESASFNMHFHRVLRVLVCQECDSFYGSGDFTVGEDGSECFCRWCGQGGQVYCCSNCACVFCKKCVRRNFGKKKMLEIENGEDWTCYVCDVKPLWEQRALCNALNKFLEEYSKEENKFPKEKTERMPGFNAELCCQGEKLPYYRHGQPLRLLHVPPTPEEEAKARELKELKEAAKAKELKEAAKLLCQKSSTPGSFLKANTSTLGYTIVPKHNSGFNVATSSATTPVSCNGYTIVPVDTRRLLKPPSVPMPTPTFTTNSSSIRVVHRPLMAGGGQTLLRSPHDQAALPRPMPPVPRFAQMHMDTPPPLSTLYSALTSSVPASIAGQVLRISPPGSATSSYIRLPPMPTNNVHPAIGKLVLSSALSSGGRVMCSSSGSVANNNRIIYNSSGTPIGIHTGRATPNTTGSAVSQPAPARYYLISNNPNEPPELVPISNSPISAVRQVQTVTPPSTSRTSAVQEVVIDDDEDVVEVCSDESQNKLQCNWMFKTFEDLEETARILACYNEVFKRRMTSECSRKGVTAKFVRNYASKLCRLIHKATQKLNSKREAVMKEYSDWVVAEREKYGVGLKTDEKENENDEEAQPEQVKEHGLLLDMDCESEPEDEPVPEEKETDENEHIKKDLLDVGDTLSDTEGDYDPFTCSDVYDNHRKLPAFKPFYSRNVKDLLRDKYTCKMLLKLIADQSSKAEEEEKGGKQNECSTPRCTENVPENSTSERTENVPKNSKSEHTENVSENSTSERTEQTRKQCHDVSIQTDVPEEPKPKGGWSGAFADFLSCKTPASVDENVVNAGAVKEKEPDKPSLNGYVMTADRKRKRDSESDDSDIPPQVNQLTKRMRRTYVNNARIRFGKKFTSLGKKFTSSSSVMSTVKLDYTDLNSKPSTSRHSPTIVLKKNVKPSTYQNSTLKLKKTVNSNRVPPPSFLPSVKLERIDVDLVKTALKSNIIKPCSVTIPKLNKTELSAKQN